MSNPNYAWLEYYVRIFLLVVTLFLLFACQPNTSETNKHHRQLFTFGTLVDITIIDNNPEKAAQLIDEISLEFERFHSQWHPWKNGDLGKLNQALKHSKP